jgi:hypothetical protein
MGKCFAPCYSSYFDTYIQRNSPVIFMFAVGLPMNPSDDSARLANDVSAPPALLLALTVPELQRLRQCLDNLIGRSPHMTHHDAPELLPELVMLSDLTSSSSSRICCVPRQH